MIGIKILPIIPIITARNVLQNIYILYSGTSLHYNYYINKRAYKFIITARNVLQQLYIILKNVFS